MQVTNLNGAIKQITVGGVNYSLTGSSYMGTTTEWSDSSYIPAHGELIIYNDNGEIQFKIGDGTTLAKDLAFVELRNDNCGAGCSLSETNIMRIDDVSTVEHELNVTINRANLFSGGDLNFTGYTEITLDKPLEPGTYTISACATSTDTDSSYCLVSFFQDEGKPTVFGSVQHGKCNSSTVTLEAPVSRIRFNASDNIAHSTGDTATITDIMLNKGTTAMPYTPYVPDLSAVTVSRVGKNLIPYPYRETTKTVNGITFTDNGDGSITINGTATAGAQMTLSYSTTLELPVGTYYYSCGATADRLVRLEITPKDGSAHSYPIAPSLFNITTPSNVTPYLYVAEGQTVNHVTVYPQLEVGDAATEYELYRQPQTATVTADGVVSGITSLSPSTTLLSDTPGIIINCDYLTTKYTNIENEHIKDIVNEVIVNADLTGYLKSDYLTVFETDLLGNSRLGLKGSTKGGLSISTTGAILASSTGSLTVGNNFSSLSNSYIVIGKDFIPATDAGYALRLYNSPQSHDILFSTANAYYIGLGIPAKGGSIILNSTSATLLNSSNSISVSSNGAVINAINGIIGEKNNNYGNKSVMLGFTGNETVSTTNSTMGKLAERNTNLGDYSYIIGTDNFSGLRGVRINTLQYTANAPTFSVTLKDNATFQSNVRYKFYYGSWSYIYGLYNSSSTSGGVTTYTFNLVNNDGNAATSSTSLNYDFSSDTSPIYWHCVFPYNAPHVWSSGVGVSLPMNNQAAPTTMATTPVNNLPQGGQVYGLGNITIGHNNVNLGSRSILIGNDLGGYNATTGDKIIRIGNGTGVRYDVPYFDANTMPYLSTGAYDGDPGNSFNSRQVILENKFLVNGSFDYTDYDDYDSIITMKYSGITYTSHSHRFSCNSIKSMNNRIWLDAPLTLTQNYTYGTSLPTDFLQSGRIFFLV